MSVDKKIDYEMQGGVKNYRPSEMVTVPKIAKSSPDTPTAKLAYITPEEEKILVDLNLYGSLKGKPNRGPGGIPSLEGDFDSSKGPSGGFASGEQLSGFETGAKGERSRADARSLGMSPKDVQDIRGGALKAGAGQTVNPGLFGPRNRPGVNVRRGPRFGMNLVSGLMSLINPALGYLSSGLGFIGDKLQGLRGYNPDGTPMSQEDYEKARLERQLTSRLDNLYDRKLTGKNYSQKNIDMLEAMGVTTSKGNIKSAIDRDIAMNPEMPQFATSYIQNLAQPNINRFSNTVAPMGVNVPSTGIKTIDVGYDDPAFDNTLSADATYDQQKNVLENILNTEDTGVGEFIEDKEQKDKRQQELLNEIMLG